MKGGDYFQDAQGFWRTNGQRISLPFRYPGGGPFVTVGCVQHQMMHCAGFKHDHPKELLYRKVTFDDAGFEDTDYISGVIYTSFEESSSMYITTGIGGLCNVNEMMRRAALENRLLMSEEDYKAIRWLY